MKKEKFQPVRMTCRDPLVHAELLEDLVHVHRSFSRWMVPTPVLGPASPVRHWLNVAGDRRPSTPAELHFLSALTAFVLEFN